MPCVYTMHNTTFARLYTQHSIKYPFYFFIVMSITMMFSYELSVLSCLRVLLMTPSSNCNLFLDQVSNNLTLPFIFIYNFYVNWSLTLQCFYTKRDFNFSVRKRCFIYAVRLFITVWFEFKKCCCISLFVSSVEKVNWDFVCFYWK